MPLKSLFVKKIFPVSRLTAPAYRDQNEKLFSLYFLASMEA
jgi:hypothetical protein